VPTVTATRNYVGIVDRELLGRDQPHDRRQARAAAATIPTSTVWCRLPRRCGMAASGLEMDVLRRTLAGYTRHPNMAAVVVLGLGCEANQISGLMTAEGLKEGPKLIPMTIQDEGGVSKTVMRAVGFLKELLPETNDVTREPIAVSELILALQCGGSDGYSGISANPALGAAVDLLVRHGGTAVLSETPEIYGAEHLLTRRAASREVGEKLVKRIKWWKTIARTGSKMNNPSPGNRPAASPPSSRSRSARWPRAARPTWSMSTSTPSRSPPRDSSIWIRRATTRFPPPARWLAAPMCSVSPRAAAACSVASLRRHSSLQRIAPSIGA
jgi:altronate dehydratase